MKMTDCTLNFECGLRVQLIVVRLVMESGPGHATKNDISKYCTLK